MTRSIIRVLSGRVRRQLAEAYASRKVLFFARESHSSQVLRLITSMYSGSAELLTMILPPCADTSTQAPPLHLLLRRHTDPSARPGFNMPPVVTQDIHPYSHTHGRHEELKAVNSADKIPVPLGPMRLVVSEFLTPPWLT